MNHSTPLIFCVMSREPPSSKRRCGSLVFFEITPHSQRLCFRPTARLRPPTSFPFKRKSCLQHAPLFKLQTYPTAPYRTILAHTTAFLLNKRFANYKNLSIFVMFSARDSK